MGPLARFATRGRDYGRARVPRSGGAVLAINHLHWVDVPLVGAFSPRPIDYVAKVEAHRIPGLGQFIRLHGTLSVRRGESDRDAVRLMRAAAANGRLLGLFVEGTRQRSGVPGEAQPGAAMVALQENVPVVPAAIHGSQDWKLGTFGPVSIAWGEPMTFEGLPKGGKGYREASALIQEEIHRLWRWLAEQHEADKRPAVATPP
jgi:1-acyl-sn-glycerol-3-phosphate acyltransferase